MPQTKDQQCRLGVLFSEKVSSMLWEMTTDSALTPHQLLTDAIELMYKNYKNKGLN